MRADAAQRLSGTFSALPRIDPHALLRRPRPSLPGSRPDAWHRHGVGRVHPRPMSRAAEEAPRKGGTQVEIKGEKVSDLAQFFADTANLPDKASRTKFLVRHRYLFRPEVVEQMAEAVVRQFARVDTRQAFGLADAAVAIAIKIGNKEIGRASCRERG